MVSRLDIIIGILGGISVLYVIIVNIYCYRRDKKWYRACRGSGRDYDDWRDISDLALQREQYKVNQELSEKVDKRVEAIRQRHLGEEKDCADF